MQNTELYWLSPTCMFELRFLPKGNKAKKLVACEYGPYHKLLNFLPFNVAKWDICWLIKFKLTRDSLTEEVHSILNLRNFRKYFVANWFPSRTKKQHTKIHNFSLKTTDYTGDSDFIFGDFYRASSAMVVCLSVCVCVCLSQVGVLLKWLNVGTRKQRHTIAQGL